LVDLVRKVLTLLRGMRSHRDIRLSRDPATVGLTPFAMPAVCTERALAAGCDRPTLGDGVGGAARRPAAVARDCGEPTAWRMVYAEEALAVGDADSLAEASVVRLVGLGILLWSGYAPFESTGSSAARGRCNDA
jgi:hypothetical protein